MMQLDAKTGLGQPREFVARGKSSEQKVYWNNPDATRAAFLNGWLRTGDIGVLDDLGLLKMVDRAKDIIISGGLNISAAEIERVIMELPGIEDVAVIAATDDKFGETPCAIVFGTGLPDAAAIVRHCETNLADFKLPRYVIVSDEPLPRLATGKVSKPILRDLYRDAAQRFARVR